MGGAQQSVNMGKKRTTANAVPNLSTSRHTSAYSNVSVFVRGFPKEGPECFPTQTGENQVHSSTIPTYVHEVRPHTH